jgi:hypothetical protein
LGIEPVPPSETAIRRVVQAIDAQTSPQARIIDAHLALVFAALAVTHLIETQTGWSIKKFVQTARR